MAAWGWACLSAKVMTEIHGGRIWAESVEGKGSNFTLLLPVNPDQAERCQPSRLSPDLWNPAFVIAGHLRRDYLLPPAGRALVDVPGGNLLYAAAGLGIWDSNIGLLARVGEDYPHEWLRSFEKHGWDTRGIHILAGALDLRYFQARLDPLTFQRANPVTHFARMNLPFPKSLLGYQPPLEC